MWTVAKIRADYEGWWLFSDWTEKIVEQHHYSNYEEMLEDYQSIIKKSKNPNVPILYNLSFGHNEPKHSMPYGLSAKINCYTQQFEIKESAVIDF